MTLSSLKPPLAKQCFKFTQILALSEEVYAATPILPKIIPAIIIPTIPAATATSSGDGTLYSLKMSSISFNSNGAFEGSLNGGLDISHGYGTGRASGAGIGASVEVSFLC